MLLFYSMPSQNTIKKFPIKLYKSTVKLII